VANEGNMKRILIVLTIFCSFPFVVISGTHAAVSELRFGYGTTTNPNYVPNTTVVWYVTDFITNDYQIYQKKFLTFFAGDYVRFEIGMGNVGDPASLLIDKIELTGPSGVIPIFNSGFETGVDGWRIGGSLQSESEFTISTEAYEGSKAAKLTVFGTGTDLIGGQVPAEITQTGLYTLSAYIKVKEEQREIPPDAVFALDVANQWVYDGSVKREIVELDHSSFRSDTFRLKISQNNTEIGNEWYERWKGYVMLWGTSDASTTYKFGDGLLVAWIPGTAGESKKSLSWVLNYGIAVNLTTTFLGTEQITLPFETFEAYRFRYNFTFTGPGGGTTVTSYDWWFVPYIGVIKQQTSGGVANLISFSIVGGKVSEVSDNDQDGLLDYKELTTYHTDPLQGDTDLDGCLDGPELQVGRNPLIVDSEGDVNGDCVVNIADAVSTLRLIAGMDELGPSTKKADVNGDGRVGSEELIWILQEISGLR
jgi:hypothetical protein